MTREWGGSPCSLWERPFETIAAMAEILLATINARYIHAAVGLRYLLANMGELRERTRIVEFES